MERRFKASPGAAWCLPGGAAAVSVGYQADRSNLFAPVFLEDHDGNNKDQQENGCYRRGERPVTILKKLIIERSADHQ